MATERDDVEQRIAANLKRRREELGLSLGQLAAASGVSKAMIGKVEACVSSPTAGLLGRLCAGLGVTLSTLMQEAEAASVDLHAVSRQPTWRDPETGLLRTLVAPASARSALEIARLRVPGGSVVSYDVVPSRPVRQHIVMLSGRMTFEIGGEANRLEPGDAIFAVIDRPTRFAVASGAEAEYLVIQEPG